MRTVLLLALLAVALPAQTPTPRQVGRSSFVKRYDTNGNGKLDAGEIDAMVTSLLKRHPGLLKRFDANGDGKLDATEKARLVKAIQERMAHPRAATSPTPRR